MLIHVYETIERETRRIKNRFLRYLPNIAEIRGQKCYVPIVHFETVPGIFGGENQKLTHILVNFRVS